MPKFTIITVVLNAEKFLLPTLQSVANQTYTDYEHLIFDGGSKDGTADLVKQHSHSRLRWISEKDKGIYDAMNKAIRHAQGEWLYFLNAGDIFYEDQTLEKLLYIQGFEQAELISGYVQTMNDPTGVSLRSGQPLELASFYHQIPVSHQGAMMKRNLFNEIGLYHTQFTVVADQEWFVRFFHQKGIQTYVFTGLTLAWYETVGFSYNNRIKGLKQMLTYSNTYFPFLVTLKNYIRFPFIVIKVKLISALKDSKLYISYRKLRYGRN